MESRRGRLEVAFRRVFLPVALLAVCAGSLMTGCNNSGVTPSVKPASSTSQTGAPTKAQNGGVDDMTLVPAPTGQKTGIEGGKK